MPLPIQSQIVTMDYPSRGLPYVEVPAKTGIATQTMDYPSRGLAIVTNDGFANSQVFKFIGVSQTNIKKALGVTNANIKKIIGVSNT